MENPLVSWKRQKSLCKYSLHELSILLNDVGEQVLLRVK